MWFLVEVVKGSKHYEPGSQVGNRVLISDTTEMVISARALGTEGYRFEARKGNDTFVVREFKGGQPAGSLAAHFTALALQMGALAITGEGDPAPAGA
jgi:hypothetical protein